MQRRSGREREAEAALRHLTCFGARWTGGAGDDHRAAVGAEGEEPEGEEPEGITRCYRLAPGRRLRENLASVEEDFLSGARSGVHATPTFFINGDRFEGDWNTELRAALVKRAP